jgi:hypothetical protein
MVVMRRAREIKLEHVAKGRRPDKWARPWKKLYTDHRTRLAGACRGPTNPSACYRAEARASWPSVIRGVPLDPGGIDGQDRIT